MLPVILSVLSTISFCEAAWGNFDTWEDRKSYDLFSHYETLDYNYRNPLFTNDPLFFDTLEPTTPTLTPPFYKRKYREFKNYVKGAWNKTMNKYSVPQKFEKFDKHYIIRGAVRQIQRFLYLNEKERITWFHDPNSSGHMDAVTYSGEKGWDEQWGKTKHH